MLNRLARITWRPVAEWKINLRAALRSSLREAGLLAAARRARRLCAGLARLHWQDVDKRRRDFEAFRRDHGKALDAEESSAAALPRRTALLVSTPTRPLDTQLWLISALTLAGLAPIVLLQHEHRHLRRYYRLAGASGACLWNEFADDLDLAGAADELLDRLGSMERLVGHVDDGVHVGRIAACTALCHSRTGSLNLDDQGTREFVAGRLLETMTATEAARRIVARFRPELAIIADCDYTPLGPIFDVCLSRGVDVISYDAAHKSNALIFKRHLKKERAEHRSSLSDATWEALRKMPWSDSVAQRLQRELESGYETRDWYSAAGTQFKCRDYSGGELRGLLGLDPGKNIAVIFPHISWDAPFAWGTQLFGSYEDWLIETVKAACLNDRVNWVIKLHPGNVKKSTLSGVHQGEAAEWVTLRERFASLPPHISVLPADTPVSTHSVLAITDCCLTVRGTIGMEAAARGIPVLTAGTGRYDRRGFTIDSDSPAQYLERIACIEQLPRLTPGQQELARRYAYGLFVLRPLQLSSLTLRFFQGRSEFEPDYVRVESRIEAKSRAELVNAPDINALARWVADPGQIDFLAPSA